MTQWFENFEEHQVHTRLIELATIIDEASSPATKRTAEAEAFLHRIHAVATFAGERMGAIPGSLVPQKQVNAVSESCQNTINETRAFLSNNNLPHLQNASNQCDSMLIQLSNIPAPSSKADVRGLSGAVNSLTTATTKYKTEVDASTSQARTQVAEAVSDLKAVREEIAEQKGRLDKAIAQFQQQFSDAEAKRGESFTTAVATIREKAEKQLETADEDWSEKSSANEGRFETEIKGFQGRHAAATEALDKQAATLLASIETRKQQAEDLVHVISNTGMVGGFQKTANEMRRKATGWHIVAGIAMIGLIFYAMYAAHHTLSEDFKIGQFCARVFAATAFGILAAYGARQAERSQDLEKHNRTMELELASIGPFLRDLPEDKQQTIKEQLASKFFAASSTEPTTKAEAANGSVLDILKLIVELLHGKK